MLHRDDVGIVPYKGFSETANPSVNGCAVATSANTCGSHAIILENAYGIS